DTFHENALPKKGRWPGHISSESVENPAKTKTPPHTRRCAAAPWSLGATRSLWQPREPREPRRPGQPREPRSPRALLRRRLPGPVAEPGTRGTGPSTRDGTAGSAPGARWR